MSIIGGRIGYRMLRSLVKVSPGNEITTASGFSIFPWAHLVFTENVLMRWYRETHKREGHRFGDVRGGLNQLTIGRFEEIVAQSEFELRSFEMVPIRKLAPLNNRLTREFTTVVVRARMVPRSS